MTGVPGHQYNLTAHGEEGHTVQVQLVLGYGVIEEKGGIPFYVFAGALLLLSVFPARYFASRK